MSSGKAYKFQGSVFEFATSYDDSPGVSVTAITNADPPEVTAAAHGLAAVGTIASGKFTSVEGMVELLDEVVIVQVLTTGSLTILNRDSTGYGAFTGTAEFQPAVMSPSCEITSWNRQGGASAEIPTTTNCDDFAQFLLSYPDFGTVQVDFNYAPSTLIQQSLYDFWVSGQPTVLHRELPNGGGEQWVLGLVQQTSEAAAVGTIWTSSMTFRTTGAPVNVVPE